MSQHLPLLREMFPNELVLDVDQIAQCMKVCKGHISNLVHQKKLPFSRYQGLARSTVSIIRFAQYLDSQLAPESKPASIPVAVKKGPGRPRLGSKGNTRTQLFQSQLRAAICNAESLAVLDDAIQSADDMTLCEDGDSNCAREFQNEKMVLKARLQSLRLRFVDIVVSTRSRESDPSPVQEADGEKRAER